MQTFSHYPFQLENQISMNEPRYIVLSNELRYNNVCESTNELTLFAWSHTPLTFGALHS